MCKINFGLTCNGFHEKIKNNIFVFSLLGNSNY